VNDPVPVNLELAAVVIWMSAFPVERLSIE
jgi:hypothetical protein